MGVGLGRSSGRNNNKSAVGAQHFSFCNASGIWLPSHGTVERIKGELNLNPESPTFWLGDLDLGLSFLNCATPILMPKMWDCG